VNAADRVREARRRYLEARDAQAGIQALLDIIDAQDEIMHQHGIEVES
jgi:hypothetical protein